jgi:hypothetical protein
MGMLKLLMTWDIKPGRESEYVEFLMREFAPAMLEANLQPTDAWYTIYGEGPQVLAAGVTDSLASMHEILASKRWQELETKLLTFVDNYKRRIVEATGGFQM